MSSFFSASFLPHTQSFEASPKQPGLAFVTEAEGFVVFEVAFEVGAVVALVVALAVALEVGAVVASEVGAVAALVVALAVALEVGAVVAVVAFVVVVSSPSVITLPLRSFETAKNCDQ